MISLTVNGKKKELSQETDLARFLRENNVDSQLVAVAHNGNVVKRGEYEGILLHDGDVIEIVRMVGGG